MSMLLWLILLFGYIILTNYLAKWVIKHTPVYVRLLFGVVRLALLFAIVALMGRALG